MKKVISLFLILALVMSIPVAFAGKSKSGGDIPGSKTDGDGYEIIIVEDLDQPTVKTIEKFAAANAAGDPVSAFPQSVIDQLANGMPEVNEIIPIEAIGDLTKVTDTQTEFVLDTPYSPKDVVQLVIGIPVKDVENVADGEEFMEWYVLDAKVNEDGSLTTTIPEDLVLKLENGGTMVVVNNGPVVVDIPDTEELAQLREIMPGEGTLILVRGFNYDASNTDAIPGIITFPNVDKQALEGKKLSVVFGTYPHLDELTGDDITWVTVPAEVRENGDILTSVDYVTANGALEIGCAYLIVE